SYPRSMIHDQGYDFSFSGLKTAVRYSLVGPGQQDFSDLRLSDSKKADVCASFQAAVVDVVAAKASRAVQNSGVSRLIVGGGVAANQVLRGRLVRDSERHGYDLVIAPNELCTDNAVMGAIAWKKMDRGDFARLDSDIQPGLQRGF
ncbi:MAG: tRNA (adenosine(37)-N6)-threonylcarbamoyltransferase complex transferase subunit TsaD, partial [Planctomycetota bacterium]